jgi:uncharacterized membrane protein
MKKIIIGLLVFLIVFSGYLALSEIFGSEVCLVSGDTKSSCAGVQSSRYGSILGIKVSNIGPIAFLILLGLYILTNMKSEYKRDAYNLFVFGVIVGALGALYFLAIQFLVLKQVCSTCLVVDISMLLVMIFALFEYQEKRKRR